LSLLFVVDAYCLIKHNKDFTVRKKDLVLDLVIFIIITEIALAMLEKEAMHPEETSL